MLSKWKRFSPRQNTGRQREIASTQNTHLNCRVMYLRTKARSNLYGTKGKWRPIVWCQYVFSLSWLATMNNSLCHSRLNWRDLKGKALSQSGRAVTFLRTRLLYREAWRRPLNLKKKKKTIFTRRISIHLLYLLLLLSGLQRLAASVYLSPKSSIWYNKNIHR